MMNTMPFGVSVSVIILTTAAAMGTAAAWTPTCARARGTLSNATTFSRAEAAIAADAINVYTEAAQRCDAAAKPCGTNPWRFPASAACCEHNAMPQWVPLAAAVRALEAAGNATLARAGLRKGVNLWTDATRAPDNMTLRAITLARPLYMPSACMGTGDLMSLVRELNAACAKAHPAAVYCNIGVQVYPDPPTK